MNIDGKHIASALKEKLRAYFNEHRCTVAVFYFSDDLATQTFINIKKKVGEELGVAVSQIKVTAESTSELVDVIQERQSKVDGVIVQFPVPHIFDKEQIRNAILREKDLDCVSSMAKERSIPDVLPPVVGAINEIIKVEGIAVAGKKVVVVGEGILVGKPAASWFEKQESLVTVIPKETSELISYTKTADILVLGAGVPGLIKKDMVKEGVIVFDAGTSEVEGVLQGDAEFAVAEKASYFTPVPGGIGPITIVKIFENLARLHFAQNSTGEPFLLQ